MQRFLEHINKISYGKVIWILAISEILHNLEEAIWLPDWSKTAGIWHPKVGALEFRIADLLITLMFCGVIYYFSKYKSNLSKFLMGGVLISILFNVLMPHLLATALTLNYMPGVVLGILLNVPVTLYLLIRGLREGFYKVKSLVLAGICFALAAFPLLQLLFAVGRLVDKVV